MLSAGLSDAAAVLDLGPSNRLAERLDRTLSVRWQNVPLRDAVRRLSESQGLSIWIDRRVDTSVEISVAAADATVQTVVEQLAAQVGGMHVAIGDLSYIGPTESARDVPTLIALCRDQSSRLAPTNRGRMLARREVEIPRLAEPREMVELLAAAANLRVETSQAIPHDLWPGVETSSMPTSDLLALLLVGFDLTWQAGDDGHSIRIVPIAQPVSIRRRYRSQQLARLPGGTISASATTPDADGQSVWVDASVEVHQQIAGPRKAAPPRRSVPGRTVYSLRVQQQPLGPILEQLARQLKLELDTDSVDVARLNQRVSFEVADASFDELLEAACQPAGLNCEVQEGVIRVSEQTP